MSQNQFASLMRGITNRRGTYQDEALSVVLIVMDEFAIQIERSSLSVTLNYAFLAHLGFECAPYSFDPYRSDREELVGRCERESWELQRVAASRALPYGDYKHISAICRTIRQRTFVFSCALHPPG